MQFSHNNIDNQRTQQYITFNQLIKQSQQLILNISNEYQQFGQITINRKCMMSDLTQFVRKKFTTHKPIVCLATKNKRQVMDYLLLMQSQSINYMRDNQHLVIIYQSIPHNPYKPTLTDFTFLKCLGKGGSSSVYLVRNNVNGQLYALKQIQKTYFIEFKRIQQVLRQKKIMSQILETFPFISQLFATFQSQNHLNFLLEFYPGGQMFYHLQQNRMFEEEAKLYFCEIVVTLEFLHSKQIVYRDLKPENILIDANGHAILADFGLCKINLSSEELTNSYCGSLEYMAPQVKDNVGYNFSVDFYALGAFLYEMVVGIPPYYNNHPLQFPQHCSRNYCNLVRKLIQKNVMDRLMNFDKIKQSSWLKGVDWQKVLRKQYKMPIRLNPNYSYIHKQFRSIQINQSQLTKQQKYDNLFDFFFYMKKHPDGIYSIYANQSKLFKKNQLKVSSKILSVSKRKKQLSLKSNSSKSSKKSLNICKQNVKIQNIYTFRKKKVGSKDSSHGSNKNIESRQSSLLKNRNHIHFNNVKTVKSQNNMIKPYQIELISKMSTQYLSTKYPH